LVLMRLDSRAEDSLGAYIKLKRARARAILPAGRVAARGEARCIASRSRKSLYRLGDMRFRQCAI